MHLKNRAHDGSTGIVGEGRSRPTKSRVSKNMDTSRLSVSRACSLPLLTDPDFTVCAEAADADGAVALALREHPDVCLLDINMPGNGIAAARQITRRLPDTAVVMLTVSVQDEDLFDALRAGASGYRLKGIDETRLSSRRAESWTAKRSVVTWQARDPPGRGVPRPGGTSGRRVRWNCDEVDRAGMGCTRVDAGGRQHGRDLRTVVHIQDDGS